MTGDQHQAGQATASQAYAVYEAKQEEADVAREISDDLSTDEGMNAYLLAEEAEAAYAEYEAARVRENPAEAETADAEALERHWAAWNDPVLVEQRAADAAAEAESERIWNENRIGLRGRAGRECETTAEAGEPEIDLND
jgi:hypothetical protein